MPNDTADYNTLTGLSAGNFVINKATPTVTVAQLAGDLQRVGAGGHGEWVGGRDGEQCAV